jgi:hypothetical protein
MSDREVYPIFYERIKSTIEAFSTGCTVKLWDFMFWELPTNLIMHSMCTLRAKLLNRLQHPRAQDCRMSQYNGDWYSEILTRIYPLYSPPALQKDETLYIRASLDTKGSLRDRK